jgi:hypothetical protein
MGTRQAEVYSNRKAGHASDSDPSACALFSEDEANNSRR